MKPLPVWFRIFVVFLFIAVNSFFFLIVNIPDIEKEKERIVTDTPAPAPPPPPAQKSELSPSVARKLIKNAKHMLDLEETRFEIPKNPICSEIDAVYLWVNGSDQITKDLYYQAFGKNITITNRLRDIPTLKYSFRSLFTYAPFIRRVYLITNGQRPEWLNEDSPKIRVINHQDIFEQPENLPTFNSNAIESQLSRIPGIAPCWFSLNDDFGFGRPVHLEDWMDLKTGAQKVSYGVLIAPSIQFISKGGQYDKAIAYSNLLLNKHFYPQDVTPKTTTLNVKHKHQYEGHGVRFVQQRTIEALYKEFHSEFLETSRNKLRNGNETVLSFMYNHYAKMFFNATASAFLSKNMRISIFWGKVDKTRVDLKKLLDDKPITWCYNDDAPFKGSPAVLKEVDDAIKLLIDIFEDEYPIPCEIEKIGPDGLVIPTTLDGWFKLYNVFAPKPIFTPPTKAVCKPIQRTWIETHIITTVFCAIEISLIIGFFVGRFTQKI